MREAAKHLSNYEIVETSYLKTFGYQVRIAKLLPLLLLLWVEGVSGV